MAEAKNQHYIPQSYLRNFAVKNKSGEQIVYPTLQLRSIKALQIQRFDIFGFRFEHHKFSFSEGIKFIV